MNYQKAISNCRAMLSFLRADRGEQIKTRQINRIEEDTLKTAISAMEELEQYKQLGTLEEVKCKINAFNQIKWERDIAIEQLSEIGCELGCKMDDVKDVQRAAGKRIHQGKCMRLSGRIYFVQHARMLWL